MSELRLENVCYRYRTGDRDVLKYVTCTFTAGRLSAVVGPSGSGKTTLLSIMAGLGEPTAGKVSLSGSELANMNLDEYRRESVSIIFQSFQLFPLLTALENVCYPLEMKGIPLKQAKEHATELLKTIGIGPEMQGRYPANLSGGEQQRGAIARALSTGARVLLADEPTGNLDSANGQNIVEILTRLAHDEGYCIIIVTHDPAIANASDDVFRMQDGVLVAKEAVPAYGNTEKWN